MIKYSNQRKLEFLNGNLSLYLGFLALINRRKSREITNYRNSLWIWIIIIYYFQEKVILYYNYLKVIFYVIMIFIIERGRIIYKLLAVQRFYEILHDAYFSEKEGYRQFHTTSNKIWSI